MKSDKLSVFLFCLAISAALPAVTGCGSDDSTPGDDVTDDVGNDVGTDTGDDVSPLDVENDGNQGDSATTDNSDVQPVDVAEETSTDLPAAYPDASIVNAVRNSPVSQPDSAYMQKKVDMFRTTDVLPSLEVRVLINDGNTVYLGTGGGVMVRQPDGPAFEQIWPTVTNRNGPVDNAVVDIAETIFQDRLVFATQSKVIILTLSTGSSVAFPVTSETISAIAVDPEEGDIYVGTASGLYLFEESDSIETGVAVLTMQTDVGSVSVTDIAFGNTSEPMMVATTSGMAVLDQGAWKWFTKDNSGLPSNEVLAVKACPQGVIAGTADGFMLASGPTTQTNITGGPGALARSRVVSVACNENGFLIGHDMGATLLSNDLAKKQYFYGLRWLVDQIQFNAETERNELVGKTVNAVGLDPAGNVWLGTGFGLSRVYWVEQTLADKEAYFDNLVQYFWRMGGFFSSDGWTPDPWADPSEMRLGDKDNDGLWTQMMIGGWCFAYAATGEEKFYDLAHKAMQNMYKLIDYPWVTFGERGKQKGFISRSIISQETDRMGCGGDFTNTSGIGTEGNWNCLPPETPCTVPCVDGLMNQYDYKVCCREPVRKTDGSGEYKEGMVRWNPIEVDGKKYVWKADTSSDEIAGHFFGFPVYYDLCAKDDAEREKVASYITTLAGYIADNNMLLVDLDGTMTTFGQFSPETIGIAVDGLEACVNAGYSFEACAGEYYGGGWLNSNEGLGLLLAAWHVSGDKYFYDVYEDLVTTHKYYNLAIPNQDTLTITNPSIANHSDHELAMLAYTTVMRYEPNADRLDHWRQGFQFLYDAEKPERNPWWAAIAALSGMPEPDAAGAIRTLREIPEDLREWAMDNCDRMDYTKTSKDRHGDEQFTAVPPFDEIRTFWWNGNPYDCSEGGSGNGWNAPTVWLLPYYMALYTGLITTN